MKKMLEYVGMTVIAVVIAILASVAGRFDREAEAETYVLHGTYDGVKFVADNGETYNFEQTIIDYEGWNHDGEIYFSQRTQGYEYEVEPNTLVYVKFNDKASDTVDDDYPELVGYDWKGMQDRANAEFEEWVKQCEEFNKRLDAYIDNYAKRTEKEVEIYNALYESFSEVEEWEVTRTGNNIHIDVKEAK